MGGGGGQQPHKVNVDGVQITRGHAQKVSGIQKAICQRIKNSSLVNTPIKVHVLLPTTSLQ